LGVAILLPPTILTIRLRQSTLARRAYLESG
jgi:hypothetical protein